VKISNEAIQFITERISKKPARILLRSARRGCSGNSIEFIETSEVGGTYMVDFGFFSIHIPFSDWEMLEPVEIGLEGDLNEKLTFDLPYTRCGCGESFINGRST